MSKWKCDGCGEAENCDATCIVTTAFNIEPKLCPISGDEVEWDLVNKTIQKEKKALKKKDSFSTSDRQINNLNQNAHLDGIYLDDI